jgi:hypothetical protein
MTRHAPDAPITAKMVAGWFSRPLADAAALARRLDALRTGRAPLDPAPSPLRIAAPLWLAALNAEIAVRAKAMEGEPLTSAGAQRRLADLREAKDMAERVMRTLAARAPADRASDWHADACEIALLVLNAWPRDARPPTAASTARVVRLALRATSGEDRDVEAIRQVLRRSMPFVERREQAR